MTQTDGDRFTRDSPAAAGGRTKAGRALIEMYYQLRTEGDTPLRKAVSIWLGTMIGCLPVYGLHLFLCVVLARILRVNRIRTYLAAHINNPVTAPVLLYVEFGTGHWLFSGEWPQLSIAAPRTASLLGIGRDLLTGSLLIGVVLGAAFALVSYTLSRRMQTATLMRRLLDETSRRYCDSVIFHWEFVRGKLRYDPLYFGLLSSGSLPQDGTVLDLGCGRGILFALLDAARGFHRDGRWDDNWPRPPLDVSMVGVESRSSSVRIARAAVGHTARIIQADVRDPLPEHCSAILLLDVLHYLGPDDQEQLLRRACQALRPDGVLIIREADTALGLRFLVTRIGERWRAIMRGHWRQKFFYRAASEWSLLLSRQGFCPTTSPMWKGTPHGNVLVHARRG